MVQFIRRREAAKLLGVSPVTLSRWHKSGRVTMTRLSDRVMGFTLAEIEALAAGRGRKAGRK